MATNTTTLTLTCHCRVFNHEINIPTSSFPLKSSICHCNSCRHATGQLFATFAVIPGPIPSASFFTSLVKYESSKTLARWFCPVCGASCVNVDRGPGTPQGGEWEAATGCIEITEPHVQEGKGYLDGKLARALMWVDDTKDGGAVGWINEGRGDGLLGGRFTKGRESETITDAMVEGLMAGGKGKVSSTSEAIIKDMAGHETETKLKATCHCGQIRFLVSPTTPSAPPKDSSAELCCCTSCRKTSGFEITSWTHIAKGDITAVIDDEERPYTDLLNNTKLITHYESSKGTDRHFCNRCGAKVAFGRDDLPRLDVALGLFEAAEGSRAETWFAWDIDSEGVYMFPDDAVDKGFVGGVCRGVNRWMGKGQSVGAAADT